MKRFPLMRRRGYTLTEVLVAFSIFVVLGAMMLMLIISVNQSLVASQNKGTLDFNFRSTTSALSPAISAADFIYVFNVPANLTPANATVLASTTTQTSPNLTGDILIAVYYNYPGYVNSTGVTNTTVSRIVGVCRLYDSTSGKYPVYMFDSNVNNWGFTPTAASTPAGVIALLPSVAQVKTYTKLADSATPLGTSTAVNNGNGIFLYNGNGTGAVMMTLMRTGQTTQYVSNGYVYSVSSRNL